jgi:hypothetical protein
MLSFLQVAHRVFGPFRGCFTVGTFRPLLHAVARMTMEEKGVGMSAAVLGPRMSPVADALIARSNGRYDEEFLRILVANMANQFEGARVQDYIEVLVAKAALDELRKLDAVEPISS